MLRYLLIGSLFIIAITHRHENYCWHAKGYHQKPDGTQNKPLHFGPKMDHESFAKSDTL